MTVAPSALFAGDSPIYPVEMIVNAAESSWGTMPFRVDIEFPLFEQARFSNRFPAFYPLWENYAHSSRDDFIDRRESLHQTTMTTTVS